MVWKRTRRRIWWTYFFLNPDRGTASCLFAVSEDKERGWDPCELLIHAMLSKFYTVNFPLMDLIFFFSSVGWLSYYHHGYLLQNVGVGRIYRGWQDEVPTHTRSRLVSTYPCCGCNIHY